MDTRPLERLSLRSSMRLRLIFSVLQNISGVAFQIIVVFVRGIPDANKYMRWREKSQVRIPKFAVFSTFPTYCLFTRLSLVLSHAIIDN